MLSFRELSRILSRHYNLDAATANQTVSGILTDVMTGRLLDFRNQEEVIAYLDKLEEEGRKYEEEQGISRNPRRRRNEPVEIYGDIVSIRAVKGKRSLYPGEPFQHDFTERGTKILGLPDGSLLIKGKKRLWEDIKQED